MEPKRIVPKGPAAAGTTGEQAAAESNVHHISKATGKRGGGRPSGLGYDPAKGEEVRSSTYKEHATRESTSEYDVFTLVDERGYRADRFYTRSLNADGHGERINVRLPQGIDSQIHAAVAEVPHYRNIHDFFRDAAVHRLEWIQRSFALGDGARRILELERIRADISGHTQETETMQEAVDDLEAALQKLWDKQDYSMMREMLDSGVEMHEWLREPYKGKALDALTRWKAKAKAELERLQKRQEE